MTSSQAKRKSAQARAREIRRMVRGAESRGKNLYRTNPEGSGAPFRVVGAKASRGTVFVQALHNPMWRLDHSYIYDFYEQ